MDKAELAQAIEQEWRALEAELEGLGIAEVEQPALSGGWSVKDLLGHVAFWDGQSVRVMRAAARGRVGDVLRPSGDEEVHRWNARERESRRGLTVVQVRSELADNHRRVEAALAALPEEALSAPVSGGTVAELIAVDTFEHYREHREQILAWRRGPGGIGS